MKTVVVNTSCRVLTGLAEASNDKDRKYSVKFSSTVTYFSRNHPGPQPRVVEQTINAYIESLSDKS